MRAVRSQSNESHSPCDDIDITKDVYAFRNHDKVAFYTWLTDAQYEHLSSKAGDTQLRNWLDNLDYEQETDNDDEEREVIDEDDDEREV